MDSAVRSPQLLSPRSNFPVPLPGSGSSRVTAVAVETMSPWELSAWGEVNLDQRPCLNALQVECFPTLPGDQRANGVMAKPSLILTSDINVFFFIARQEVQVTLEWAELIAASWMVISDQLKDALRRNLSLISHTHKKTLKRTFAWSCLQKSSTHLALEIFLPG